MLFEQLQQVYRVFVMGSPLLLITLISIGLFSEGKKSGFCILTGIVTGLIGCLGIQPIDPGPWGWGVFLYPFIFSYWFSLGYLVSLTIRALLCEPRRINFGGILLLVLILLVATFILDDGYCKRVEGEAYETIRDYLNGTIAQSELEAAGFQETKIFKEEVNRFLHQAPEKLSEEQVRFLAKHGFDIYKCASCPRDLIEAALKFDRIVDAGVGLPMFSLNSLAENPKISEADFVKLASLGTDDIFRALIVNPVTDEKRYRILRPILVKTIDANPVSDHSDWYQNRLLERLQHLDAERQRRLDRQIRAPGSN